MSPRTNDDATPDAEKATPDENTAAAMPDESTVEPATADETAGAAVTGATAAPAATTAPADAPGAGTRAGRTAGDESSGAPTSEADAAKAAPAADTAEAVPGDDTPLTASAGGAPGAVPAEAASAAVPSGATPVAASVEDGSDAPADGDTVDAADERVAAVRRLSRSQRRWRAAQLGFCAAALAVAMTAGAMVLGTLRDGPTAPAVAAVSSGVSPQLLASGDLDASIRSLQAHLRTQPKDFGGWATLGLAYVEQARTKGDPSRYPQAQEALGRSLKLRPDYDPALAGRAALAAARHDFTGALKYADLALEQNPYSERALSSRIDALVELGRYDEASKAADLADSRKPGVPVFTRFAYVHELRGDVKTARRVLEQALATATGRGDVSYVASALGQLAWNQGDYHSALTYYARALAADDTYLPALEGRARTQAALGDRAAAIKGMEQIVQHYPLPQPLVELGELYEARGAAGDARKARDQYTLVNAWISLAHSYGVNADLDTALAAADHGDHKAALTAARAEWARRHTVHTADALGWALHVSGRDAEALRYARRATATGYRNASFLYHLGVIERANGHTGKARTALKAALDLNPGFSPLGAREAREALEAAK
ncbi:tetratricopeptide repeat protein [Streptomyces populi]|uniref:tetratricopeptide repeat protein n=1 Tax=Streptomyces populi TaxID=2058924 RepID=UPI0035E23A55